MGNGRKETSTLKVKDPLSFEILIFYNGQPEYCKLIREYLQQGNKARCATQTWGKCCTI